MRMQDSSRVSCSEDRRQGKDPQRCGGMDWTLCLKSGKSRQGDDCEERLLKGIVGGDAWEEIRRDIEGYSSA